MAFGSPVTQNCSQPYLWARLNEGCLPDLSEIPRYRWAHGQRRKRARGGDGAFTRRLRHSLRQGPGDETVGPTDPDRVAPRTRHGSSHRPGNRGQARGAGVPNRSARGGFSQGVAAGAARWEPGCRRRLLVQQSGHKTRRGCGLARPDSDLVRRYRLFP